MKKIILLTLCVICSFVAKAQLGIATEVLYYNDGKAVDLQKGLSIVISFDEDRKAIIGRMGSVETFVFNINECTKNKENEMVFNGYSIFKSDTLNHTKGVCIVRNNNNDTFTVTIMLARDTAIIYGCTKIK